MRPIMPRFATLTLCATLLACVGDKQSTGLNNDQEAQLAQYVLAEVTLSFLGLGVSEPTPSWGNMLAALQQYHVLVSYWWMWVPGLALLAVSLAYYALSEVLHQAGSAE